MWDVLIELYPVVPFVVHSNHVQPQSTFRYLDWITVTVAGAYGIPCRSTVYVHINLFTIRKIGPCTRWRSICRTNICNGGGHQHAYIYPPGPGIQPPYLGTHWKNAHRSPAQRRHRRSALHLLVSDWYLAFFKYKSSAGLDAPVGVQAAGRSTAQRAAQGTTIDRSAYKMPSYQNKDTNSNQNRTNIK